MDDLKGKSINIVGCEENMIQCESEITTVTNVLIAPLDLALVILFDDLLSIKGIPLHLVGQNKNIKRPPGGPRAIICPHLIQPVAEDEDAAEFTG